MSRYAIIIEKDPDSDYGAWSPDLPGCVATGKTEAEALSLMKEAIAEHLAVMRDHGDPIPEPHTVNVTVIDAA